MGQNSSRLTSQQQKIFPSFYNIEDLSEFYIACQLSRIIYYENDIIQRKLEENFNHLWFNPSCYQISLPNVPQKMMIIQENHKLYITLCGTQSWNDWLIDSAVTLKPNPLLPGTFIHHGFLTRFMKIPWKVLISAAIKLQKEVSHKVKIILCGHSLAGALVQLISCCILKEYKKQFDIHCFTFGQPLLGDFTQYIKQNKWEDFFHSFYHINDPIPFIFRNIPHMEPFGTLIMISDKLQNNIDKSNEYIDVELTCISNDIFNSHQWKSNNPILSNIPGVSIQKVTNVIQESVAMKKHHSIDNYYNLLSFIFQQHKDIINIYNTKDKKQNVFLQEIKIIPSIHIHKTTGKFIGNGKLIIFVSGINLNSINIALLGLNIKNEEKEEQLYNIRSSSIHYNSNNSIEIRFDLSSLKYKIQSSKTILSLSNCFEITKKKCILPFHVVWLVGKTGSGKTQLRLALEQNSNNNQNNSNNIPKVHVIPEKHEEYERSYEYNKVKYYEFNGFTLFNKEESQEFLHSLENNPPQIILLLINITETIREIEVNKLREFIQTIKNNNKIPLWIIFTHYSMVDERIRTSVIENIKKELKLNPNDLRMYHCDSVSFKTGNFEIPSSGISIIQNDIENYLENINEPTIIDQDEVWLNLLETSKALLQLCWRNKTTIISSITTISTLGYYLLKLRSNL